MSKAHGNKTLSKLALDKDWQQLYEGFKTQYGNMFKWENNIMQYF